MTGLDGLRREHLRWRSNLDLTDIDQYAEHDVAAEDLLFRLRAAISTYRSQVLPHLAAEREMVLPALIVDPDDEPLAAGHAQMLAEELWGLVDRMDAIQVDLMRYPDSTAVRGRTIALLTAAAALATVAMRFGDEVVLPLLPERLGPHDSEQIADAVEAYERTYR